MNSPNKKRFFSKPYTLNCGGRLLQLDKPIVMGILNLTPDSFYDGGKFSTMKNIISHAATMLDEGAAIIDIGAISTKPGAADVDESEEINRLIPVLQELVKEFSSAIFSVDTFRSAVAKIAVDTGAQMINDISAGGFDENMFATIAALQVPYIMMHIQGTPAVMQQNPVYNDVVKEVMQYFVPKVHDLKRRGVHDIIIDPGFGFGKTVEHNFTLLRGLEYFEVFELPLMVGLSRKSMINKVLGTNPKDALNGTTALNMLALTKGANILRVHDVREAIETVKLFIEYAGE